MRSRVLPSTAGVRVRSAAPRPVALSLHNRQVQEPPAPARQLAALSDERQLLRARSTELRGSPLRASTDRAFACLPNLISLCSAGAPPALLLSSASACTPRLPACLPALARHASVQPQELQAHHLARRQPAQLVQWLAALPWPLHHQRVAAHQLPRRASASRPGPSAGPGRLPEEHLRCARPLAPGAGEGQEEPAEALHRRHEQVHRRG